MMRTTRTYYEILGLPRDATLAHIKRRYKQLVRKYYPDVAVDKQVAHRLFIQINEAYQALSDPVRRRDYDASLSLESSRPSTTSGRYQASSTAGASRSGGSAANRPAGTSDVAQRIRDAQLSFIQKRFQEAAGHCRAALSIDGRNAQAHAVLGDIYRAQGKFSSAVKHYSYAMQFNPSDRETEKKLTRLVSDQISRVTVIKGSAQRRSVSVTVNMVLWGLAFFLIALVGVHPGTPIGWLATYVPVISGWSWNLVALLAACSGIVGVLLALNGLVDHPDDELVFETHGSGWMIVPTGPILLIGSGFFFPGAAAFYLVMGLLQNSLSRSVIIAFTFAAGIVGLASLMYLPQARGQVLLFGGNVSFLSILIGWYVGAAFRPMSQ